MKRFLFVSSIVGFFVAGMMFVGVAIAQQGNQEAVVVTISDDALNVTPSTVNINANMPFTLSVNNTSSSNTYSLVIERSGDINQPIQVGGNDARISNIAPGQWQTETWTIDTPGTYQLAAYTDTNATTASNLVASFTVVAGTQGVTGTETVTATVEATGTAAATETVEATGTTAATATVEATGTTAAAATSAGTVTETAEATGTVAATGVATGTAEATLPQTGGTDDSMPMSLALITLGALLAVGGLVVGRKLARR